MLNLFIYYLFWRSYLGIGRGGFFVYLFLGSFSRLDLFCFGFLSIGRFGI